MTEPIAHSQRNITLLALAQALLLANGITLVAINSLLGLALAPSRALATLPITTYVIGGALAAYGAAHFMKRHGRRAGFMVGAAFAIAGALISAWAVHIGSFWLLCFGTILAGIYNAIGQQYRFAAADSVSSNWKARAISLTLAGGILGGIFGPELSKYTRDLLPTRFLASHLALAGLAFISLLIVSRLKIAPLSQAAQHAQGRPLREIARQPAFVVALLAATCGYATMNLLMTATPLAMDFCGHPFSDAAFVLQWHVIGMFGPSFITGDLIKRFGVRRILLTGAAVMLLCAGIALSGIGLMHFWWALLLLGVGWNFLFIGGTTLLTETCRPEERATVQGSNDFIVMATQAATSLISGVMIMSLGWHALIWFALPLIALTGVATWRWRAV
jgi:MFS family permease